ncbi:MAG: hypothetical protein WAK16_06080 [Candidatus Cybelea sp.]
MKHLWPAVLLLFAFVAPAQLVADPPERTSTVAARQLVNVTVYNGERRLSTTVASFD